MDDADFALRVWTFLEDQRKIHQKMQDFALTLPRNKRSELAEIMVELIENNIEFTRLARSLTEQLIDPRPNTQDPPP